MFCNECGQRLADDAKHCPNCGAPVTYRPESRPVQPEPAAPQPEQAPAPETSSYYENTSGNSYTADSYTNGTYENTSSADQTAAPAPSNKDSFAVVGLCMAILSIVSCCVPYISLPAAILGIIFSAMGLKSQTRHTMALIGLIISIVFIVFSVVILILSVSVLTNSDFMEEFLSQYGDLVN